MLSILLYSLLATSGHAAVLGRRQDPGFGAGTDGVTDGFAGGVDGSAQYDGGAPYDGATQYDGAVANGADAGFPDGSQVQTGQDAQNGYFSSGDDFSGQGGGIVQGQPTDGSYGTGDIGQYGDAALGATAQGQFIGGSSGIETPADALVDLSAQDGAAALQQLTATDSGPGSGVLTPDQAADFVENIDTAVIANAEPDAQIKSMELTAEAIEGIQVPDPAREIPVSSENDQIIVDALSATIGPADDISKDIQNIANIASEGLVELQNSGQDLSGTGTVQVQKRWFTALASLIPVAWDAGKKILNMVNKGVEAVENVKAMVTGQPPPIQAAESVQQAPQYQQQTTQQQQPQYQQNQNFPQQNQQFQQNQQQFSQPIQNQAYSSGYNSGYNSQNQQQQQGYNQPWRNTVPHLDTTYSSNANWQSNVPQMETVEYDENNFPSFGAQQQPMEQSFGNNQQWQNTGSFRDRANSFPSAFPNTKVQLNDYSAQSGIGKVYQPTLPQSATQGLSGNTGAGKVYQPTLPNAALSRVGGSRIGTSRVAPFK